MIKPGNVTASIVSAKGFYKYELAILAILCLIGLGSSYFTFPLLNGYKYNFGKNLIGLFIPPLLSLAYLTIASFKFALDKKFFFKALILYFLQIIPFTPLFFQVFQPTESDDFARYYLSAQNMLSNHTLWGGDRLVFKDEGNYYVTQPGYRYFVASELLVFRNLYRFVQFINIAFLLFALYLFQNLIQKVVGKKRLQVSLSILILLFTPFAVKNLLMGLPEWLTVSMLMIVAYLYLVPRKEMIAMFILGLVPFFRQNLLITVLLLAFFVLLYSQKKLKLLACFAIPLFLPVYHNLYYAGEWRFFVRVFNLPFLNYSSDSSSLLGLNLDLILRNVLHYLGLDVMDGSINFIFIAAIFLPFFLILYFILLNKLKSFKWKLIFLVITMSAIVPAILLGTAYYPRFEFVNVAVVLVTFLVLYDRLANARNPGKNFRFYSHM
jgi:hypothetical protein